MKKYNALRNSKVVQVLFLLFASLLVFEIGSKSVLYFILGIKEGNYAHYYLNDSKLKLLTWTENYDPHPYFGYESSSLRTSERLLSEVGDDDFVVGILGGSVAGSFAEYSILHPSHFESLRKVIPSFGDKKLRIVNLANGGFKQPQQFFVAVYFLENLNLAINIDGFNDAAPAHLLPIYPLAFPLMPQFLGRTGHGGIYLTLAHTARWIYKNITRAPLSTKLPGLSRSSSYFLTWYYLRELLYRVVRGSEAAYYENEFGAHQSEALRKTAPTEFIQKRIAIWKKYTVLEDDLMRKQTDKSVFFFLQPNQYLKNSKRLSEQEKQVAIDPNRSETNHEMMLLLKSAAEDLRHTGVPMTDLTGIFSETDDTVYIDDCCHVNDKGNEIMANAIISNIMLYHQTLLH